MVRVRLVFWLVLALASLVAAPARAQAVRAADSEEVTVLAPPPAPALPPTVATLEKPPDLTDYLGKTLEAVDVVLDDERWPDERAPSIASMRPGDKVTTAIVRKAMDEALTSGHFADAHVTFELSPSGAVRAVVHVMPRKVVDSARIDLHGAPLDPDEILRDLDLVQDAELVGREIPRRRAALEATLQRRGFPAPQVDVSTRGTDDPLRVIVLVDVQVGAPRRIERRVVYPYGGTSAETELAERSYAVKAGQRADERDLDAADAALQLLVRARGFHKAEVSHDVVLHRGLVVLRVRVDFGTRYETRYEGNEHYDRATLDEVLDLENETDRSPSHLVQKIHDYYVKHGLLDADVTLEDRGGPKDPAHYLVFHIAEHGRVYVAARSYPCLREDDVKRLSEGGPSSAKAIGSEIDSYLEEELPGNEVFVSPRASGLDRTIGPLAEKGSRPTPLELDPDTVYAPETYERAVGHVQELYRAEGFLSAQVGPVQVMRRRCDPRSPPGECRPMPVPPAPDVCTYDATGMPLPVPPLEQGSTCVPDVGRGLRCEDRVWLRIPVKLGPRTQLYDAVFDGARHLTPKVLADAADLQLGRWVSSERIEEARRKVSDAYKEEGYAFVDVKYALELSPDRTRARVRFTIAEGEQVIVRQIVIRGNVATKTTVIAKRIALEVGGPYRASLVRKTEERIATLGVFSSVQVGLENPYVPQRNKVVIITVIERPRQYTEVAPGFSTGEGFRVSTEYGHRNLWGSAIALTLRLQLAYIPTPLIFDDTARNNYRDLNLIARLAIRATAGIVFPEVGLGPLVRTGIDTLLVHDLQRDFYLTKLAAIPNINYHPIQEFQVTFFQSFELNNSRIFQAGAIVPYLQSLVAQGISVTDFVRQLLVPDGESYVFSQRLLVSWDRRDNPFNASRGTYVVSGIEHVDGFPITNNVGSEPAGYQPPTESHFFKLTQTFGGYIPITKAPASNPTAAVLRFAALTRIGANVQITSNSSTYPDRLFFLGGPESMRGWTLNSFIPQDDVDRIFADQTKPDFIAPRGTQLPVVETTAGGRFAQTQVRTCPLANPACVVPNTGKFTQNTRPIRGGNFMFNERVELRIPIRSPFETVIFGDIGNLWIDPTYAFEKAKFPMRADVGPGVRVQTPVGPLALDYGINITRQPYEDFGALNFAIGLF